MAIEIVPISRALGAEIRGLDLTKPLSVDDCRAVDQALNDHVVLLFRGQDLSEDDQIRVAEIFGKVSLRRRPPNGVGPGGDYDSPFMLVTNIVENGKPIGAFGDGEMWFHHDTSYYPEPRRATLLYAVKLPSSGGNTCFSNMYKAYENLPEDIRSRIEGRNVLQVHDYKRRERLDMDKVDLTKVLNHEQPIVIRHPKSGRKALYISRLMSMRIMGLEHDESESILAKLADISEDPAIVYEHEWQYGDLVVWDNWASIHCRKDFPREEPRLMRRLIVEGQALVSA
ncbi:MAG: hypothetical protein RLZ98_1885 [Pseudomonadota bacterium]|jgi:taurine dioxygenase